MENYIQEIRKKYSKFFNYENNKTYDILTDSQENIVTKLQLIIFNKFLNYSQNSFLSDDEILEILDSDKLLKNELSSNNTKILQEFKNEDFLYILSNLCINDSLKLCYEYFTVMDNSTSYSNFVEKWIDKYPFLYNFQPVYVSKYTVFTLPDDLPLC